MTIMLGPQKKLPTSKNYYQKYLFRKIYIYFLDGIKTSKKLSLAQARLTK